ncbi:MAG: ferric reductase-like transmembrane domain-containing protein [Candidatus Moraniibacteriota bacterium]
MGFDSTGQLIQEIPWAGYFARAGGLVAFLLLYFSIFFGLAIRLPILKNLLAPVYSFSLHKIISVQAFIFVLLHVLFFFGDKYLDFGFKDIFVPFASVYKSEIVALGVFGMYIMFFLIISTYLRRFLTYAVWRAMHFLNIILYIFIVIHAYYLGSDLQGGYLQKIFIGLNIFLAIIFILALIIKLKNAIMAKTNANLS